MLTIRTHCLASEEEEMKRLEVALTDQDRWIDREIKGERGDEERQRSVNEKMCVKAWSLSCHRL